MVVYGVPCIDRLDVLMRVFEHELAHLICFTNWLHLNDPRGSPYQAVVNAFFGHLSFDAGDDGHVRTVTDAELPLMDTSEQGAGEGPDFVDSLLCMPAPSSLPVNPAIDDEFLDSLFGGEPESTTQPSHQAPSNAPADDFIAHSRQPDEDDDKGMYDLILRSP